LIRDHGWKVIDLADERRVHASDVLARLPERKYLSADDVVDATRHLV